MLSAMTVYRYPFRAIRADYLCAGTGLGLCAVPLAVGTMTIVTAVLVPAAVLFAAYGLRTAIRQSTRVTVSDDGIGLSGVPRPVNLTWGGVESLALGHFSAWREGMGGWMQLRLTGPAGTIRVESTLDGFHDIVRRAVAGAAINGLSLDPATTSNLGILGIEAPLGGASVDG